MSGPLYPAFLDLSGKRCVVVGGGAVARRKAEALAEAGARVVVIAPQVDPALTGMAEVVSREYRAGDLEGAWLAVAATDCAEANRQVAADGDAAGVWVNVADRSAPSSFIVPAGVRRGPITIAVSTAGASPALAAKVRDVVAEAVGPAYGEFAAFLNDARPRVQAAVADPEARRRLLRQVADDGMFECFCREGRVAAEQRLSAMIRGATDH